MQDSPFKSPTPRKERYSGSPLKSSTPLKSRYASLSPYRSPSCRDHIIKTPSSKHKDVVFITSPHKTPRTPSKRPLSMITDPTLIELDATPCKEKKKFGIFASNIFKGVIRSRGDSETDGNDGNDENALTLAESEEGFWNASLHRPVATATSKKASISKNEPEPTKGLESRTLSVYKRLFGRKLPVTSETKLPEQTAAPVPDRDHQDDNVFFDGAAAPLSNMLETEPQPRRVCENSELPSVSACSDENKVEHSSNVFDFPSDEESSAPKKPAKKRSTARQAVRKVAEKSKKAVTGNFVAYKLKSKYGSGKNKTGLGRKHAAAFKQVAALSSYTYKSVDLGKIQNSDTPFAVSDMTQCTLETKPSNIQVSISTETDREGSVLKLLNLSKFKQCSSILIVVLKQKEANALASLLNTYNFTAASLHSGIDYKARQLVQQRFEGGKIRLLVCTFPFSLKASLASPVSGIIYCSAPKSLSQWMQHWQHFLDGKDKLYVHVFLRESDYLAIRSLAFCNGVEPSTVHTLISHLAAPESDKLVSLQDTSEYYGAILPLSQWELLLDCDSEMVERLLKGLETMVTPSLAKQFYRHPKLASKYRLAFPKQLPEIGDAVHKKEWAILQQIEREQGASGSAFVAPAATLCYRLGLTPEDLLQRLDLFQAQHGLFYEASGGSAAYVLLHSELCGKTVPVLEYRVEDLVCENLDVALDALKLALVSSARRFELETVAQIDLFYNSLIKFSKRSFSQHLRLRSASVSEEPGNASLSAETLQELLDFENAQLQLERGTEDELFKCMIDYLSNPAIAPGSQSRSPYEGLFPSFTNEQLLAKVSQAVSGLEAELEHFIELHSSHFHSGRAVARVLHGLSSPRYSAAEWSMQKTWGAYRDIPFEIINYLSNKILLRSRTKV